MQAIFIEEPALPGGSAKRDLSSFTEIRTEEIEMVSGGIVVAPVIVKVGAWAAGTAFGAGLVLMVEALID